MVFMLILSLTLDSLALVIGVSFGISPPSDVVWMTGKFHKANIASVIFPNQKPSTLYDMLNYLAYTCHLKNSALEVCMLWDCLAHILL